MKNISVGKLRHRAELPLLITSALLTLFTLIVIVVGLVVYNTQIPDWTLPVLAGILLPSVTLFYSMKRHYWKTISNGVEITDKQFPEVYQAYRSIALKMGFGSGRGRMASIPRLYLGDAGKMKSDASKYRLFKGYVVIAPDILYLAYKMNDLDGVSFILAHELGHIKCGHVDNWRLIIKPAATIFLIDQSLNRAQEWTADRCAYYYAPEGKKSLLTLYAGKTLYAKVDFDEYIKNISTHKDGLWQKLTNFLSSYPTGFRRMEAIKETDTKGWDVNGKML